MFFVQEDKETFSNMSYYWNDRVAAISYTEKLRLLITLQRIELTGGSHHSKFVHF